MTIGGVDNAHYKGDFVHTNFESTSYWQDLDGPLAGPTKDVESIAALVYDEFVDHHLVQPKVHRQLQCHVQCRVHRRRYRLRAHQEGSCDRQFGVETDIVITGPSFGYYSAVLDGTSGILYLVLLAWSLQLFNNVLWDHVVKTTCARWKLIEYILNTFAFVLSGVHMVVKL